MSGDKPYAYFITFTCYGARLHGDSRGTVGKYNNIYDTPDIPYSKNLNKKSNSNMKFPAYLLDKTKRDIVLKEITKTCQHFNWKLFAAHVRSNHVHIVVQGDISPEEVMKKIKSFSSRSLNYQFPKEKGFKKWTAHGSTRYLWRGCVTEAAIHYVLYEQGDPMAFYENKSRDVYEDLL